MGLDSSTHIIRNGFLVYSESVFRPKKGYDQNEFLLKKAYTNRVTNNNTLSKKQVLKKKHYRYTINSEHKYSCMLTK